MKDTVGRTIDYLRVSVTDRCNLRCTYCVPAEGVQPLPDDEVLTQDELMQVLATARSLGVRHVRFTGGEPLVRLDLAEIIARTRELGIDDISLTTNGVLLAKHAATLKAAGLDRVNVSLDSLRADTFSQITRVGNIADVLAGIKAAIYAGLHPVKINVVVMAGVNDGEVADLARLSIEMPVHVRFIEVMPIGPDADANNNRMVPADEIMARIAAVGDLRPAESPTGAGPAKSFRLAGAQGTVGFIAPLSSPFCGMCNRVRLTSDGKLRPCLASDIEIDLRPCLRKKSGVEEDDAVRNDDATGSGGMIDCLASLFSKALELKPKGHELWNHPAHMRRMCQIGG